MFFPIFPGTPEQAARILKEGWVPECDLILKVMCQIDEGKEYIQIGTPGRYNRLWDYAVSMNEIIDLYCLLIAYSKGQYRLQSNPDGSLHLGSGEIILQKVETSS